MYKTLKATIPTDESVSSEIDISNLKPISIITPSAWTAADITLQTSLDGENWKDLYKADDTEVSVKAAADRNIKLGDASPDAVHYLRFRSGTLALPVEQAAAREIVCVCSIVDRP